jgi:hypothetical protein
MDFFTGLAVATHNNRCLIRVSLGHWEYPTEFPLAAHAVEKSAGEGGRVVYYRVRIS